MSVLLTPLVSPSPIRAKIVFPSQPPLSPLPSLSSVAGGALGATAYLAKITFVVQTQDGVQRETLPSNEVAMAVAANSLLNVGAPTPLPMPYAVIGWNVYVGKSSGGETRQNTTMLAIGVSWTEPTGGLVAGPPPPSTWGNTLITTFPPREVPYFNPNWVGHDEISTAGFQQSVTWYVDNVLDFRMEYIKDGDDAAAWQQFLQTAIQRVPFDFYQDSTQPQYVTVVLTSNNPKLAWKSPGFWSTEIKARQVVLSQ